MSGDYFNQMNKLRAEYDKTYMLVAPVNGFSHMFDKPEHKNAMSYGQWLYANCYASREGWRSSSVPYLWEGEISNEKAYEMYLESLKDK